MSGMTTDWRATTLKQAYRLCDVGPLTGEALERYYVELSSVRSEEAISSVKTRLEFLQPGEFRSVLFTGHRGCGKSTELRRLQQEWEKSYRVLYLETDVELDINDADYSDLYLVIIKRVAEDLARMKLKFDAKLLKEFEDWFKEITEETVESVEKAISAEISAEAGFEVPFLSKLMTKLLAQIKGSQAQKTIIRSKLQQGMGRLKSDMNRLLKEAFNKVSGAGYEKGYLVIFDNLDRMPLIVGDRLYFDYASQLQDLNCTLIFTVPISVVYSDKNLNNAFGAPNVVPMVDVYRFKLDEVNLKYDEKALARLAKLITSRMDHEALFESKEIILKLVAASGGHVRQLMQMTATACLMAATRRHVQIQAEDVDEAIKKERINFERLIPARHYPLLAQVCGTKQLDQTEDGQKMLFNTSVLEYEGVNRWNYVNPVIKEIENLKVALVQSTTEGVASEAG